MTVWVHGVVTAAADIVHVSPSLVICGNTNKSYHRREKNSSILASSDKRTIYKRFSGGYNEENTQEEFGYE